MALEEEYLEGVPVSTLEAQSNAASMGLSSIPSPAYGTTEDCLMLDVVVPKTIYNNLLNKGKN